MKKRKTVYICDHCGAAALQESYFSIDDTWKGPPEYWTKLGKEDLCPKCSEVYKKLKEIELMKKYVITV